MPERRPARKRAASPPRARSTPAARRAKPTAPREHETDARTVDRIERAAARALAAAPVAHDLPPAANLTTLGAVQLQELDGSWTTLGALWAASPTAIVFLRHYG